MKSHQPEVFLTTLEKTNRWVNEICDLLHWDDRHKAYHGLRAVLHALRDRLPVPEAAHLGAQLPMLIRGMFYEDWKPAAAPIKIKTAQEFYDLVQRHFRADRNVNPMRLTEAVLKMLSTNTSPGELEKVLGIFPPELRALWHARETVDLSDLG